LAKIFGLNLSLDEVREGASILSELIKVCFNPVPSLEPKAQWDSGEVPYNEPDICTKETSARVFCILLYFF
jgi:hypothetical protein